MQWPKAWGLLEATRLRNTTIAPGVEEVAIFQCGASGNTHAHTQRYTNGIEAIAVVAQVWSCGRVLAYEYTSAM